MGEGFDGPAPIGLRSSTNRRNLVKAGALILAEIERLDRMEQQEPSK